MCPRGAPIPSARRPRTKEFERFRHRAPGGEYLQETRARREPRVVIRPEKGDGVVRARRTREPGGDGLDLRGRTRRPRRGRRGGSRGQCQGFKLRRLPSSAAFANRSPGGEHLPKTADRGEPQVAVMPEIDADVALGAERRVRT
jgi:hypothetical protein